MLHLVYYYGYDKIADAKLAEHFFETKQDKICSFIWM